MYSGHGEYRGDVKRREEVSRFDSGLSAMWRDGDSDTAGRNDSMRRTQNRQRSDMKIHQLI
jgi:hypothetical protein